VFQKVPLLGQISNLPNNFNFVVSGPSALGLRGGTTTRVPLWITGDEKNPPYLSKKFTYFYKPDLTNILTTKFSRGGFRCATKEQALVDCMIGPRKFDNQVIVEYLWLLLAQKEDEDEGDEPYDTVLAADKLRWIEERVIEAGLMEDYQLQLKWAADWRC
jgi:hypothetical protein